MEEYLDVLDEKGEKTGESKAYDEVHRMGLIHRSAHVWIVNPKGQILIQKRAKGKRAYPEYWDISAAGHISSGETSLEGAKKETREELGIDLPDQAFNFLCTIRSPIVKHSEIFIDNEFNDIYIVNYDLPISEFKIQKEELDEVKWIDKEEFKKWINGKGELLVPHEEEYKTLLEYLDNKNG